MAASGGELIDEPVVFSQAVEGLLRGLGSRLVPALEDEMRALGVDPSRILPLYPRATWFSLLTLAAARAWPDQPPDAAFLELGRAVMRGYARTLVGAAVLRMLTLVGPRRAIDRVRKSFRSADNYTETRLTPLSSTAVELWLNQPGFSPHYVRGIILELFEGVFHLAADIAVISSDASGVTYRVSWREHLTPRG